MYDIEYNLTYIYFEMEIIIVNRNFEFESIFKHRIFYQGQNTNNTVWSYRVIVGHGLHSVNKLASRIHSWGVLLGTYVAQNHKKAGPDFL